MSRKNLTCLTKFPNNRDYPSTGFEELIGSAIPFNIDRMTVYTLGYEEMLWHIYRHAFGFPLIFEPIRLIYVADMVSLVEKFWDIFHDAFFPSAWWLRLYYGVGGTASWFWYRWIRHPLHILGWLMQYCAERFEKFKGSRVE